MFICENIYKSNEWGSDKVDDTNTFSRACRCVHYFLGAKSKNPKPNGVRFRDLLVTLSGLEPEFAP